MKVLVFGTFDTIHKGHVHFLKESRKYGDCLIVVVSRDSTALEVKGRYPEKGERERLGNIMKLGLADKALLGNPGSDKYNIIEYIKPDVICLGYDQEAFTQNLEEELRKRGLRVKVVRLKPYMEDVYKSSKIKAGT